MKTLCLSIVLASMSLAGPAALAQHDAHHIAGAKAQDSKPVNAMCPVGKEAIVLSAGTVDYKGNTIGICCPGCGEEFLAWDENRKDQFITLAMAGKEPGQLLKVQTEVNEVDEKVWTEPYALNMCPVSGEELGSMDDTIIKSYKGREVRFCCEKCIGMFEADQAAYMKKIDEQIIKDQLPYYPMQTCIVSGESLVEDGESIATDMVYGNRLVRLCCKMCKREFKADPEKFIAKLNQTTADAQRADYPLNTCVVGGGELGSMGEPFETVIAGRLMRFCCEGCEPKANANPLKYIAMVDQAWRSEGKFMPVANADQE